jgi:hypothetical protein
MWLSLVIFRGFFVMLTGNRLRDARWAPYSDRLNATIAHATERSDNALKLSADGFLHLRILYDDPIRLCTVKLNMQKRLYRLSLAAIVMAFSSVSSAENIVIPPLASGEEVARSVRAFRQWTALYQQKDYEAQYLLVHPRIQKYKTRKMWKKAMNRSQRRNGQLDAYDIYFVSAIAAEKIPCTEMGHCYRKDMQVVMIVLNSHYSKIGDMGKEYVLMTRSSEEWFFGGGTFLNRPFGETMGILDRYDEKRYEYNGIDKSKSTTYHAGHLIKGLENLALNLPIALRRVCRDNQIRQSQVSGPYHH